MLGKILVYSLPANWFNTTGNLANYVDKNIFQHLETGLNEQNHISARKSLFLVNFIAVRCTTTTWKTRGVVLHVVLPIIAYTGRLRPKGILFPGSRYMKEWKFHQFKNAVGNSELPTALILAINLSLCSQRKLGTSPPLHSTEQQKVVREGDWTLGHMFHSAKTPVASQIHRFQIDSQ